MERKWESIHVLSLISMISTTVVIPHAGSTETLIAVLIQLQMQTVLPVHIYIIDCSTNKSGLRIAQKFCFNTVPIKVEVVQGTIYQNWNRGILFSRKEHPDAGILIINDDVLLPVNAIELFQEAHINTLDYCYVPETPPRQHYSSKIETYFQNEGMIQSITSTNWMSGFVFYLTPSCIDSIGLFDERFVVWYGDTDYERRILQKGKIKIIHGLYVYHYGSRSYDYQLDEVQKIIDNDRIKFYKKIL